MLSLSREALNAVPAHSHSTSGVLIVERLSESFKTPRGLHLKTHGHVTRVQKGLHQQRVAPLGRLPFYELQIADALDGQMEGSK